MIYAFSRQIAERLEKKGYMVDGERELVAYGLFSLLSNIFYFIICLLLGKALKCSFGCLLFFISFLYIKRYSGGYHAKTEAKCMIISTFSVALAVATIYLVQNGKVPSWMLLLVALMFTGTTIAFSPVAAQEKPLSAQEYTLYRRKATIRSALLFAASFLLHLLGFPLLATPLAIAITLGGILNIAGKIDETVRCSEQNTL